MLRYDQDGCSVSPVCPYASFVFLEDVAFSNLTGVGFELNHSAYGLHRVSVDTLRAAGAEVTKTGVHLRQSFGKAWGLSVSQSDGTCIKSMSSRGRLIDLQAVGCAAGIEFNRLEHNDPDLIFPGPDWNVESDGRGWDWPVPSSWSARPYVFSTRPETQFPQAYPMGEWYPMGE